MARRWFTEPLKGESSGKQRSGDVSYLDVRFALLGKSWVVLMDEGVEIGGAEAFGEVMGPRGLLRIKWAS